MSELVYGIVASVVFVISFVLFIVKLLPDHWSGRSRDRDMVAWGVFPYSEEFKNGMKRHVPILGVMILSLALASIGIVLTEAEIGGDVAASLCYFSAGIGFVVYFPLTYLIIYRNIPRFLVAPHYRNEESVLMVRRKKGTLWRRRTIMLAAWVLVIAVGVVLFQFRLLHDSSSLS